MEAADCARPKGEPIPAKDRLLLADLFAKFTDDPKVGHLSAERRERKSASFSGFIEERQAKRIFQKVRLQYLKDHANAPSPYYWQLMGEAVEAERKIVIRKYGNTVTVYPLVMMYRLASLMSGTGVSGALFRRLLNLFPPMLKALFPVVFLVGSLFAVGQIPIIGGFLFKYGGLAIFMTALFSNLKEIASESLASVHKRVIKYLGIDWFIRVVTTSTPFRWMVHIFRFFGITLSLLKFLAIPAVQLFTLISKLIRWVTRYGSELYGALSSMSPRDLINVLLLRLVQALINADDDSCSLEEGGCQGPSGDWSFLRRVAFPSLLLLLALGVLVHLYYLPAPSLPANMRGANDDYYRDAAQNVVTPELLPVMETRFNLHEIIKQFVLLEDHLNNRQKRCVDCIFKHLVMLEALAEEGVALNGTAEEKADYERVFRYVRIFVHKPDGQTLPESVQDMRKFRKELMNKYVRPEVLNSLMQQVEQKKPPAAATYAAEEEKGN
uniref:Transmembrane protein n=1 Tax=Chromera velia CCMP2878 TaxID=1169474 RepID=A0A0G4F8N4_9ALVE|eukprot:Cvel_2928.t1-p1 / transcript=Cvel_2928.t1 / gene=Cvel_2928 / organism=Chromera_velia_CCMP2878 / gene_product=hypothetical protein / transcript_product=hypothetical protein / location=Cvel_scaffold115:118867-120720(-) / protein_length=495 / sequence_SO=supercontig / SO=protein_coding / is_pseudo=false